MMPTNRFLSLLAAKPCLVADGAMGTSLFKRGLESGAAPELWNVDHPDRVQDVHREYVEAGSDIILTNSFGGNRQRLKLHNAENRVHELAMAAARLARQAADAAGRMVAVGGSIGPTGELLQPVGALGFDEAVESFATQAAGLRDGGADLLWIETMSSAEEVAAAVQGAARTGLPVVATMTFDTAGRTMMGVTPADARRQLGALTPAPVAVGANCGLGPTESVLSLLEMTEGAAGTEIFIAKANCGIPQFRNGEFSFTGTPALMADYALLARDCGARIIGGCCGSDGVVIRAIAQALATHQKGPRPDAAAIIARLGPVAGAGASTSADETEKNAVDRAERRNRRRRQ